MRRFDPFPGQIVYHCLFLYLSCQHVYHYQHLHKTNSDVNNIMSALSSLPIVAPGVMARRVIPNIGTITYLSTPTSYFIQYISWSIALTR